MNRPKDVGKLTLEELMAEVRHRIRESAIHRRLTWIATGKTYALVHLDELSNKSPLGLFVEYRCPSDRSARRLVPAPTDHICSDLITEFVQGSLWMYPKEESFDIPVSANELEALRGRFWELIHELESDA